VFEQDSILRAEGKHPLSARYGCRPTADPERYRSIDTLRGLALFGVLMVNLLTVCRLPLLESIFKPHCRLSELVAAATWKRKEKSVTHRHNS